MELQGRFDCAIKCYPCHDLGIGELARFTPDFPDAFVRLAPDILKIPEEHFLELPSSATRSKMRPPRCIEGIHELAIDIELELAMCGIANSYRPTSFVAREPGKLDLG